MNRSFILLSLCALSLYSCKGSKDDADASGAYESVEVIVSAEVTGQIERLDIQEGDIVTPQQSIGWIDSTQLYLKREQLAASRKGVAGRLADISKQLAALKQQLATYEREHRRIEALIQAGAANQKQADDLKAQIDITGEQIAAQQSSLEKSNQGLSSDGLALEYQIKQLDDQIGKCTLRPPFDGTILVKYAQAGELSTQGKPLYKIANMQEMILRVFLVAPQLTQIKLGQKVTTVADFGKGKQRKYEGKVIWISDKAEFTPKTVQTKDERENLVYAVKVAVKNDGYLKIGMYGGVKFQ